MSSPFSRTTRSLYVDSARLALLVLFAAIVGLFVWMAWFGWGNVTVFEVSRAARIESGSAPHEISALQAGRLSLSRLQVGRSVRLGEVLIELDATAEKLRINEEETRFHAFPSKIASLHRQIESVRAALDGEKRGALAAVQSAEARLREAGAAADFASETERRMRAESAAGSVAQIDALRAAAEARKASLVRDALLADAQKLRADAQSRRSQGDAELEELTRTLATLEEDAENSRATISQLKQDIEKRRIRAPVDGIIGEALSMSPGAYVAEGRKLATIIPRGDLVVVAEFNPTTALGRIRAGQEARLRLDGYPWTQFGTVAAKVSRVSGDVRDNNLHVELVPDQTSSSRIELRHGLTGVVEVSIESVSPSVLLLRAAGQTIQGRASTTITHAEMAP